MKNRNKIDINGLPRELLSHMFSFFKTNELNEVRNVSKLFNVIAENEYIKQNPLFDYAHPKVNEGVIYDKGEELTHIVKLSNYRLVFGSPNKLWILDMKNDPRKARILRRIRPPEIIKGIVKLHDNDHFAAWDYNNVFIWNYNAEKCIRTIQVKDIVCVEALPNNKLAIGHSGGVIEICDFLLPNKFNKLLKSASNNAAFCIKSLPGMRLVSGHFSGKLKIWDYLSGKYIKTLVPVFMDSRNEVRDIIVLTCDQLASSYADGSIRIWNYENGKCLFTIKNDEKLHGYKKYNESSFLTPLPNHQFISITKQAKLHIIDYLHHKTILKCILTCNYEKELSEVIGSVVLNNNQLYLARKSGLIQQLPFPLLKKQFKEFPDEINEPTRCLMM